MATSSSAADAAAATTQLPPGTLAGSWATATQTRTPDSSGIIEAMTEWCPEVEGHVDEHAGQLNDLHARLVDLEVRTGAAVTEGASQVAQTAVAVLQTAEYARGVELAALLGVEMTSVSLATAVIPGL